MKLPWNRRRPSGPSAETAFNDEAVPHMAAVYQFALRLAGGRREEAEDLVQDTFVQAYRGWSGYEPGTNCRAWLFTICRNRFLRREKQRKRRPEVTASDSDADIEALAATTAFSEISAADPERDFFESFLDEDVIRAIDALAEPYREAVVLSDLEGFSYPEISEVLGVPVGTVKSRLYRGRRLLQQALYGYALEMGYVRLEERE